ncbi:MAG: ankyrin repeat domain-containing protein [Wolbachia endosymbiont of Xenopsylla cheopis]
MPIQETEESNIVDQLQVVYRLDDELETSSESSDSGIDFPKFNDTQEPDDCESTLPNDTHNLHSRIERIFQTFGVTQYCNNVNKLPYILALLSALIKRAPNINYDRLIYKEAFDFFIKEGIDVNSQNEYGLTPLHLAIDIGDIEAVRYLLTIKNINPFIQDNNGRTPFDYAKKEDDKNKILQTLIDNKYGSDRDSLLHLAAEKGDAAAVKYLIKKGIDSNLHNTLNHTPLHLAAGKGHVDVIKILITEGKKNPDVFEVRNHSPIHYAINNKQLNAVKLLFKLGADINIVSTGESSTRLSPLHIAVSNRDDDEKDLCLDIVKYLTNIPHCKINSRDYQNQTPLHYAVDENNLNTVAALLMRKDIDLSIIDNDGKSPLDYAQKPILDVLHRYIEIKNNYEIANNSNSASYCLATLMIATSFVLIVGSSILLNDVIAMQDDYARYMCVGFIMMAAIGILSSVNILTRNYIEKKGIKEDFEYQIEKLIKNSDNIGNALAQPKIENIPDMNFIAYPTII